MIKAGIGYNFLPMKPKDLPFPYSWEDRRPLLKDGVLFVPDYYQGHSEFPKLDWSCGAVFANTNRVVIEYCSGNGAWIIDKALSFPAINWVAVEWRFDRVRKIWSKKNNTLIPNLFIVCGEAVTFTSSYVQESSVSEVYVNFPDPWPKEKHAKNRLIQQEFIQAIAKAVVKEGKATFVTDAAAYSRQMVEQMQQSGEWRSHFPSPYFVSEWDGYGPSYFNDLWTSQGRSIFYHQFINGKG